MLKVDQMNLKNKKIVKIYILLLFIICMHGLKLKIRFNKNT